MKFKGYYIEYNPYFDGHYRTEISNGLTLYNRLPPKYLETNFVKQLTNIVQELYITTKPQVGLHYLLVDCNHSKTVTTFYGKPKELYWYTKASIRQDKYLPYIGYDEEFKNWFYSTYTPISYEELLHYIIATVYTDVSNLSSDSKRGHLFNIELFVFDGLYYPIIFGCANSLGKTQAKLDESNREKQELQIINKQQNAQLEEKDAEIERMNAQLEQMRQLLLAHNITIPT